MRLSVLTVHTPPDLPPLLTSRQTVARPWPVTMTPETNGKRQDIHQHRHLVTGEPGTQLRCFLQSAPDLCFQLTLTILALLRTRWRAEV